MQTVTCPKCGKELKVRDPDREFMFCECCGEKIEIAPFIRDAAKSEKSKSTQKAPHHTAADVAYRFVDAFASPFEEYRREKEEAKRKLEEEQRRQEEEARMAEEQARIRREERARCWNDNQKKILMLCRDHPKETLLALALCAILFFAGIAAFTNGESRRREQAAHSAELARLEEERIANSHLALGEVMMPSISSSGDYRNVVKKLKDAGFTNVTAVGKGDLFFGILDTENDIIEITVDGAPDFKTNTWYSTDVPIYISYHSFYSSSTSDESSSKDASSISASVIPESEQNDFCFAKNTSNYEQCVWISPSEKLVRQFAYYSNGISLCMTGRITSGSYKEGYTAHFDFSDGETTGWDQTFRIENNKLYTVYDDGSSDTYDDPISMDSVRKAYKGTWIEVPEGRNPTEFVEEYVAEHSSSSETASSVASKSSTEKAEDTTLGYVMNTGNYRVYYYVDFANHEVYYFTYGNGDETAMKAIIVSGNFKDGITIHFNYDKGWDEKISFTKYDMTLTDSNGSKYSFSKAPTGAVKQVLSTKTVIR